MPSVAADSSFLYSLFEPKDRTHNKTRGYLSSTRDTFVVNLPVITEVLYLLDYSVKAQCSFLRFAETILVVDQETAVDIQRIAEILTKYADLPADFADASILAMCERLGLDSIATLDSDFDIYRLSNGHPLTNVLKTG